MIVVAVSILVALSGALGIERRLARYPTRESPARLLRSRGPEMASEEVGQLRDRVLQVMRSIVKVNVGRTENDEQFLGLGALAVCAFAEVGRLRSLADDEEQWPRRDRLDLHEGEKKFIIGARLVNA